MRWLLLLIALIGVSVQSQDHTARDVAPNKQNAEKAPERRADDDRGTEKRPFVIKALEPEKSPERIEEERTENKQKADRENRLIFWTLVLASVTGVLALIAGGQLWMFWRQLGYMRDAIRDGEIVAKAARDGAKLAREEFISTHRPRLIVRRVSVDTITGIGFPDILKVEFVVANVGDTKAKIVEMSTRIWFPESSENLPAIPPYGDSTYPGITFESGQSGPMTHNDSAEMLARFQTRLGFARIKMRGGGSDNGPALLFIGYIDYEDGLERKRRTAFCRIYDFATSRFDLIPHPDYEYQD